MQYSKYFLDFLDNSGSSERPHACVTPKSVEPTRPAHSPRLRNIISAQALLVAKADRFGSFTSIAVDNSGNARYPVILIGTNLGFLLKIAEFRKEKGTNRFKLVEATHVFNTLEESCKCTPETGLNRCPESKILPETRVIQKILIQYSKNEPRAHVAFSKCIANVPLRKCDQVSCCEK